MTEEEEKQRILEEVLDFFESEEGKGELLTLLEEMDRQTDFNDWRNGVLKIITSN